MEVTDPKAEDAADLVRSASTPDSKHARKRTHAADGRAEATVLSAPFEVASEAREVATDATADVRSCLCQNTCRSRLMEVDEETKELTPPALVRSEIKESTCGRAQAVAARVRRIDVRITFVVVHTGF